MRLARVSAGVSLLLLLAAPAPAAAEVPVTVAGLREAFRVPADAEVVLLGEDGSALDTAEFEKRLGAGMHPVLTKDPAKGEYSLKLKKEAPRVEQLDVTTVPPLDSRDITGRSVRSADLHGKPTLLSFFFAACAPCILEVPILNAYRRKHPEYNYVALTFDDAKVATDFVEKHGFEWPVVATSMSYMEAAGIKGYPTRVLLSENGTVLDSASGLDQESMQDPVKGLATFEKWMERAGRR
jgi:peroxiredoxin